MPADDLIPSTHHSVSVDDARQVLTLLDDVIERLGSLRAAISALVDPGPEVTPRPDPLGRMATALELIADRLGQAAPQTAPAPAKPKPKPAARPQSPPALPIAKTVEPLVTLLRERGIGIDLSTAKARKYRTEWEAIAETIGMKFTAARHLLPAIRRAINGDNTFALDLTTIDPADAADIHDMCQRALAMDLLEEYDHLETPSLALSGTIKHNVEARNFLSGGWLERFVFRQAVSAYNELIARLPAKPSFGRRPNAFITLPNNDEREVDLLFSIGTSIYAVEAKSGQHDRADVEKYAAVIRAIGIDAQRAFLVLADTSPDRCESLSQDYALTACDPIAFTVLLKQRLAADYSAPSSGDQ